MSDRSQDPFFWRQCDVDHELAMADLNRQAAAAAEQFAAGETSDSAKLVARDTAARSAEWAERHLQRARAIADLMADDLLREVPPPAEWVPIAALFTPRVELWTYEGPYPEQKASLYAPREGGPLPAVWIVRCDNGDDVYRLTLADGSPPAVPDGGRLLGHYAYYDEADILAWYPTEPTPPDPAAPPA